MDERFVGTARRVEFSLAMLGWLAFVFGMTWLLSGCSSEESPTDAVVITHAKSDASPLAADFARRVNGNFYSSVPGIALGMMMWSFSAPNVVGTTSVEGRVGNAWLMLTFLGTYSLSGDVWPLTMTCHIVYKTVWWTGDGLPDVEMTWDEEVSVTVKFSGDALVVNGVRYGKMPA